MDELTYTYDTGNKLQRVSDNANDTYGFKDDIVSTSPDTTTDYTYDANGNMLTDTNKGITTNITYNHLNLPTKIIFSTGNITYIYNAAGQKVQKTVVETGKPNTVSDYLGGYQYNNTTLKFFPTAEGYVEPVSGSYKYVYQYKDHLGNVRQSYKNVGTVTVPLLQIEEENNYYPFGLKHKGYNVNTPSTNDALKYKYNGKELQDELGLNMYDYSARNYDPALGRFANMDDHSENHYSSSPYTYAYNNPIIFVDPDGKDGVVTGSGTKDDPYVVKANYYYYGLDKDQKAGVNGAVSDYNNGGKAISFKNGDSEVFVQFNLSATEVDNADMAKERADADTVEVGDKTVSFGNTINSGTVDGENHLGNAGRKDITLDRQQTEAMQNKAPGVSLSNIYKGTMIHEIGHNLGGNHKDPGKIMSYTYATEINNSGCLGNCGTGVYNYSLSSVNANGVRSIMGRMGQTGINPSTGNPSSYNVVQSIYLNAKENKSITEGSVGKLTLIQNR